MTTIPQAILSLCVPVEFLLSSFKNTSEKPGTSILIMGVAGNAGLSGGNSGFNGSFSDATTIEYRILLSFSVRLIMGMVDCIDVNNSPIKDFRRNSAYSAKPLLIASSLIRYNEIFTFDWIVCAGDEHCTWRV